MRTTPCKSWLCVAAAAVFSGGGRRRWWPESGEEKTAGGGVGRAWMEMDGTCFTAWQEEMRSRKIPVSGQEEVEEEAYRSKENSSENKSVDARRHEVSGVERPVDRPSDLCSNLHRMQKQRRTVHGSFFYRLLRRRRSLRRG